MVNYVDSRIAYFTESTLANVLTVVGFFALILLTLWIIWYGYQIVMGSTQHTARDFAYKAVRAWIIIAFATGLAASMGFSIRTVTTDLSNMVSSALTGSDAASACVTNVGNNSFTGCKIDKNLVRMQAAMAFVNQLDTGADPVLEDKKTRASLMTAAGIGGPAIVAGGLLLTLKVAMALFIALGPIFIMCLLFKPTTPLFQKWLYYGLSTMFATAMFAVVSDIAMDLVENTTAALFVSDLFTTTLDPTGASNAAAAGIMNASVQQLGLGLMLSTLLITTPPMAANFFNGVMGSFNYNSAFGSFGSAKAPAQNGAPGTPGNPGAPASPAATNTTQTRAGGDIAPPTSTQPYIPSNNAAVNKDVIKTDSPMGNASKGFASSEVLQADRTIKDPPAPTAPTSPKVDKT
jgi:type IV secretion system protein VirB6